MSDEELKELVGKNAAGIEDLLGVVATNEATRAELLAKWDESNTRFEALRLEGQRNREEFRQSWNDAIAQMEKDRAQARERADADRAENAKRFDAQQEVIQRLLVELVDMNRENRRLRDRVDRLEAS